MAVSVVATSLGSMATMLQLWRAFCPLLGLTNRVHGKPPAAGAHALWVRRARTLSLLAAATLPPFSALKRPSKVANHYQWTDWPMLQLASWPTPLVAVVKSARCCAAFEERRSSFSKPADARHRTSQASRRSSAASSCTGAKIWAPSSTRAATRPAGRRVCPDDAPFLSPLPTSQALLTPP